MDVDVDGSTVIPFNGDRFLLCSDGLFGEVTADQISSVLRRLADPDEAADELVRLANESGGRDNITVVIVEVVDDDGRSAAASAALAAEASRLAAREAEGGAGPVDGEEPATTEAGDPSDPYVPVFADRRSSLPDATDDFDSDSEDFFGNVDRARSKRFTWRVAVFVIALLAVVGVVIGAIVWSGSNTYFVGFEGDNVAVYQGKPGGVLWIDPELQETTQIERSDLPEDARAMVAGNKEFGSEAAATRFIVTLQSIIDQQEEDENATTSTTVTTTTPAATTTVTATTAPATPTTTVP